MSEAAGYQAKVYICGASTAITDEACSQVGSTKTYKITNADHRILDQSVAIVVKDGGTAVAAADLQEVRPLFGEVELAASYTPSGVITVDGAFLPLCQVPGAFDVKLSRKNTLADATKYLEGDAQKRRQVTLQEAQIDLKGHGTGFEDYDSDTDDVQSVDGLVSAGTPTLLHLDPSGEGTRAFRSWMVPESNDIGIPLADLCTYSTSWQSTQRSPNNYTRAGFGWGAP